MKRLTIAMLACAVLASAEMDTVFGQDSIYMDRPGHWTPYHGTSAPVGRTLFTPNAQGGITVNIVYEDDTSGMNEGFADPAKGATRKATLDCVLMELTACIDSRGTLDLVVKESETDGTGFLGFGSPFFDGSSNGCKSAYAQQHITTNVDPDPGNPDGCITIDFGYMWNDDKADDPGMMEFDLYSVLLHEMMHVLGVVCSMDATGKGLTGMDPDVRTKYDGFLESAGGTNSIDCTTGKFVGAVGDLTGTGGNMKFDGTATKATWKALGNTGCPPLYTPDPFEPASSLSHFDSADPNMPDDVVMLESIAEGETRRKLHPLDVGLLVDLCYPKVSLDTGFCNIDASGRFGVGFGLVTDPVSMQPIEWLDWGVITNTAGSNIVSSFTFGYGTSVLDTSIGGPGASVQLAFYSGIQGNCLDAGALPLASFALSGLPGSLDGSVTGYVLNLDLSGGSEFCAPTLGSPFGFGFTTTDDDGTGLRATGPMLCYAGDPSSPQTTPDENGQVDGFDQWTPDPNGGTCLGTFTIPGGQADASWYLKLATVDAFNGAVASSTTRNGGTNPSNYSTVAPPILGDTFAATATAAGGGFGVFLVGYATPLSFPTTFGQLLVNIADPGGDLMAGANGPYIFSGGTAFINVPVPKDVTLSGLAVSTQVFEFGAGVQLYNAQDLVIGVR